MSEPYRQAVVVIPVLDRPDRVPEVIWSLEHGRGKLPYRALFVCSPGDTREIETLRRHEQEILVATWPAGPGDWAKKVNLAYRETVEPWIFLGADDLCWCPGWLDYALACAAASGASVIGTNDLSSPRVVSGQHSCHPLVRRRYIDDDGTIDETGQVVCDLYDHNFCDDELVETAKARDQWHFCRASMVEHLHPHWGKASDDATYRKGQARFAEDRRRFRQRTPLWTAIR